MTRQHKKHKGMPCGCCGRNTCNGQKNSGLLRIMRKLGQKRRFSKIRSVQDGW